MYVDLQEDRQRPAGTVTDVSAAFYRCPMELLEREEALAALAEARDGAARGAGRAVLVSGEPGIGKTALVTRFLDGLDDGARGTVRSSHVP